MPPKHPNKRKTFSNEMDNYMTPTSAEGKNSYRGQQQTSKVMRDTKQSLDTIKSKPESSVGNSKGFQDVNTTQIPAEQNQLPQIGKPKMDPFKTQADFSLQPDSVDKLKESQRDSMQQSEFGAKNDYDVFRQPAPAKGNQLPTLDVKPGGQKRGGRLNFQMMDEYNDDLGLPIASEGALKKDSSRDFSV